MLLPGTHLQSFCSLCSPWLTLLDRKHLYMDGILLCAHCGLDPEGAQDFVLRGNEVVLGSSFWVWWLGGHESWVYPLRVASALIPYEPSIPTLPVSRGLQASLQYLFPGMALCWLQMENTGHATPVTLSPRAGGGMAALTFSWSVIRFNS